MTESKSPMFFGPKTVINNEKIDALAFSKTCECLEEELTQAVGVSLKTPVEDTINSFIGFWTGDINEENIRKEETKHVKPTHLIQNKE